MLDTGETWLVHTSAAGTEDIHVDDDESVIGEVIFINPNISSTARSRACLAAAAPELYRALFLLSDFAPDEPPPREGHWLAAFRALKKARGE